MKVLFVGGGTMGSVTPLLAMGDYLKFKQPGIDFFWIGTKDGPERKVVEKNNIDFKPIYSGKLRRYFSWKNFSDILRIKIGFLQSFLYLAKLKPDIILSAGGYIAVPVVWAGWFLGIPSIIHQQDVKPGLANKLCAWCASKITICFSETAAAFNTKKVKLVGNPVRELVKNLDLKKSRNDLCQKYNLNPGLPVVLVQTGGRGAMVINDLVLDAIPRLAEFCQVVHITGQHRSNHFIQHKKGYKNYHEFDFLADNSEVLNLAWVIISRAGMGTLTEIAYLSKASVVIPIPNSHQQENARYFKQKKAACIIEQSDLDAENLVDNIKRLVNNKDIREKMGFNAHQVIKWGAEEKIGDLILS